MRILFLDIDGVLNTRESYSSYSESATLDCRCIEQFNELIAQTECKIVLSSAWRYMVHGGDITLRGFEYLLRTHGVTKDIQVVGITRKDADRDEPRHCQILDFLLTAPSLLFDSWVVIDNMEVKIKNFYKIDDSVGLTPTDVRNITLLFERQEGLP